MKYMTDELFRGNLRPQEDEAAHSVRLQALQHEASELLSSLLSALNDENAARVGEIISIKNDIAEEIGRVNFANGFSLGLRLTAEAFFISSQNNENGGESE